MCRPRHETLMRRLSRGGWVSGALRVQFQSGQMWRKCSPKTEMAQNSMRLKACKPFGTVRSLGALHDLILARSTTASLYAIFRSQSA